MRMNENVKQIASALIEQHGIVGAVTSVRAAIAASHASGDNYSLSIWRDVRRMLQTMQETGAENSQSEAHPKLLNRF